MHIDRAQAAALLDWYRAMGVDEAIADTPSSWSQAQALPGPDARLAAASATRVSRSLPPPPFESGMRPPTTAARELAQAAATLDGLRVLVEAFDGCALKKTAKTLCFARGSQGAQAMIIGEAPSKDDDEEGAPFRGRAGHLLDRMLAAIGLDESNAYLTNLVFWRPPGSGSPSPADVQACLPFVERQIELVAPRTLVFLGQAPARHLAGAAEGIPKLRGRWLSYAPQGTALPPIPAIATLHPAHLLTTPIAKRLAWRDLMALREALDAPGATP